MLCCFVSNVNSIAAVEAKNLDLNNLVIFTTVALD